MPIMPISVKLSSGGVVAICYVEWCCISVSTEFNYGFCILL
jgi:hypothetical protein